MAAVVEPKDPAAKHNSQVDEQIAQATSRIRTHDLAFGGLTLAALVLVYATTMIALDRYLDLPEWVRQISLAAFLTVSAGTAYLTLLSPLRKRINPLYAALRVERTIDDPKNSVTGYVDAREKDDLNPTVRAALASKAAKAAAEADVNRAVDHRSLIYIGGVAVAFLLALVVLFFVFRPTQFASLVGRAFVPFSSDPIASRTQLTLVKPEPADATITTGQTVTVAVYVAGRVPKADTPEKVRLLVRHNPADPNYDELPMVQGDTSRDWELRVPDYLVQNGFWYKVAAGDAVTPEHRVTVRSLPAFGTFRATYEYPKYLRRKSETTDDPVVKAYRGTTVTLAAKANRHVRDALMVIEPGNVRVAGVINPNDPEEARFVFRLAESGKYRLTFNATNGERAAEPFQGLITVESDAAPQVVINTPEEDETTEPANGQVKIDGKAGDDFGVDTVTLKMRIVSPVERPLKDVPFPNGASRSFRRAKDDTWPTDVDYKGSIDLARLTKDAADLPLELTPEMVIEYWLEATDNCTEPKPNVGVSKPKRVRLTAPKVEEKDVQNLDRQKDQRQNEEKKHNDDQKKKLDSETREPKGGQQKPDQKPEPNGEGKKDDAQPNTDGNPPQPGGDPKKEPDKKDGMGAGTDTGDPTQPKTDPMGGAKSDPKPDAKSGKPDPKLDQTAQDLKNELDRENKDGGSGKPNNAPPPQERADPAASKPQPKDAMNGTGNAAEPKPEPKEPKTDPANPTGKDGAPPAQPKPEGNLQQPEDPSKPKPEPKQPDAKAPKSNTAPSETRSEPFGAPPGTEKPEPKDRQPDAKDPNAKQDPASGSCAKPSTQKKDGDPSGMGAAGDQKSDPAARAGSQPKPMPEQKRGDDKPNAQPKAPPAADPKTNPADEKPGEPEAGGAKPQSAPPAGAAKPQPKDGPPPKGTDPETKPDAGANNPMKPNATNAAEVRPEAKKEGAPGAQPVEKGGDKPQPRDDKPDAGTGAAPPPKPKLDENQKRELEKAANDLVTGDEKQKQDAREKLDKAIGPDKRKEMEKLANDLKSPDEKTRADAQKKLEELKQQAQGDKGPNEPKTGEPPALTEEQKKELENAVNDLQSPDPDKKRAAQEKLDKAIGQQNRKDVEQMMEDLKSDDKQKRDAAQKKLDDFRKEIENRQKGPKKDVNDPKGKEPTPQELEDLAKKAQDLRSKDDAKRQQAQKELDEKIGEENRKKLEEMMKDQKPGDPAQQEKLKEQLKEWKQGLGQGTPNKGRMEDDPKNRLKSAELMLEQFEKEENRKLLQAKKGWTDAEYDEFLKGWRERVDQLRKEASGDKVPTPAPKDDRGPMFNPGGSGKVDPSGTGTTGTAGVGGPTVAPPGFEDAKRKFEEALKKKRP